jgi:hypothetical protein
MLSGQDGHHVNIARSFDICIGSGYGERSLASESWEATNLQAARLFQTEKAIQTPEPARKSRESSRFEANFRESRPQAHHSRFHRRISACPTAFGQSRPSNPVPPSPMPSSPSPTTRSPTSRPDARPESKDGSFGQHSLVFSSKFSKKKPVVEMVSIRAPGVFGSTARRVMGSTTEKE